MEVGRQRQRARLMGSVWKPYLMLYNALSGTLKAADQEEERFRDIATTRFNDPIFDGVNHRVWINHLVYWCLDDGHRWVSTASVREEFQIGCEKKNWRAYPAASNHQPVVATLSLLDRDQLVGRGPPVTVTDEIPPSASLVRDSHVIRTGDTEPDCGDAIDVLRAPSTEARDGRAIGGA